MSGVEPGQDQVPLMEYIVIGDKAWLNVGDTWIESDAEQAEGMASTWGSSVSDAEDWETVGTETVNDVQTRHYTSGEETSISVADPDEGGTVKMDIQGEVWVADEEGLPPVVVRERMRLDGGFFPFALPSGGPSPETETGTFYAEYDLTDINTSIIINPPGDASQMPAAPPASEPSDAQPSGGEASGTQPELPPPPEQMQTKARPIDNMLMIYVPLGEFWMGDDSSPYAPERPTHLVYLDGFWMDQNEVTNAQYRLCVDAGACVPPSVWENSDWNGDQQPVLVAWSGAQAYCQWVGGRLPTEAEWEKGARGTDGRLWPWGDTFEDGRANLSNDTDGYGFTAPVGSFPGGANPYGLLDMAGNAAEWVADWYDKDYYAQSPAQNPTGPAGGEEKVVRSNIANGGGGREKVRTVARYPAQPEHERWHYGFRCVMTTQP